MTNIETTLQGEVAVLSMTGRRGLSLVATNITTPPPGLPSLQSEKEL